MLILHISNDFGGTEVYKNLYQHLDKLGVKQTILVPVNARVKNRVGNHDFEFETKGSKIVYSFSQKWFHRYLYGSKIEGVVKDTKKLIDLNDISLIHAGTLCMTGAVAYEISKKSKIPYIVSIRKTDINTYFKKMWWKKEYFSNILEYAASVVFISPQYKKDCFEYHFKKATVQKIKDKTKVIPNGINAYYLENRVSSAKIIHNPVEIVYAAGFKNNKNLLRLIQAIDLLINRGYNVKLTAVGRSLPNRKVSDDYVNLLDKEAEGKSYITLLEYKNNEELCELYKTMDIFVMPSIHETFGLSYAEALSQGLPIVYTKGQGFDGFYDEGEVGFGVEALSVESIAKGIELVIENYNDLVQNVSKLNLAKSFDWNEIATKYQNLYKSILSQEVK